MVNKIKTNLNIILKLIYYYKPSIIWGLYKSIIDCTNQTQNFTSLNLLAKFKSGVYYPGTIFWEGRNIYSIYNKMYASSTLRMTYKKLMVGIFNKVKNFLYFCLTSFVCTFLISISHFKSVFISTIFELKRAEKFQKNIINRSKTSKTH